MDWWLKVTNEIILPLINGIDCWASMIIREQHLGTVACT